MSVEERIALIDEIWDSIGEEDPPLSDAQRVELDRRLHRFEASGSNGMPAADALALLERRGR